RNGYMSNSKMAISVSLLFAVTSAGAQSNDSKRISWWLAYYLKYSINKKWIVNAEIQARNFAEQPVLGLFAVRTGVHYYISKQWIIGFGSAWFRQQQVTDSKKKVITDELRLWEDIRNELTLNKWKIINQFRTEQRYWMQQDDIAFRFRYR